MNRRQFLTASAMAVAVGGCASIEGDGGLVRLRAAIATGAGLYLLDKPEHAGEIREVGAMILVLVEDDALSFGDVREMASDRISEPEMRLYVTGAFTLAESFYELPEYRGRLVDVLRAVGDGLQDATPTRTRGAVDLRRCAEDAEYSRRQAARLR